MPLAVRAALRRDDVFRSDEALLHGVTAGHKSCRLWGFYLLACQLRWVAVKAKTQRVARYLVYTIHVLCLGIVLSFTRTQVL